MTILTKAQVDEIEARYPPVPGAGFTWRTNVQHEIVALCATIRELREMVHDMNVFEHDGCWHSLDALREMARRIEEVLK